MNWWEAGAGQAHEHLLTFGRGIMSDPNTATRWGNRDLYRQLYDLPGSGLAYGRDDAVSALESAVQDGLFWYNGIQVAVDSVLARLATAKPRVSFLTNGATWTTRVRARNLQRYIRGVLQRCGYHRQSMLAARDAALADIGLIYCSLRPVDADSNRWQLWAERIDPDELLVDNAGDAYYGRPLTMIRARMLGLEELNRQIDRLPGKSARQKEELKEATKQSRWLPQIGQPGSGPSVDRKDNIRGVIEAWYPGFDGGKGRYVMAVEHATIIDDPMPFFPFASIAFFPPSRGFFGKGIASRVFPGHMAVAETLRAMSIIWRQMAKPTYWLPTACQVPDEHVTSEYIGAVLRGGTAPPQIIAPQGLTREHMQLALQQIAWMLESVGLTELATMGQKPPGLDSGVALREASDLVSGRQAQHFDAMDNLALDTRRVLCQLGTWATKHGIKLVGAGGGRGRSAVEWSQAALDEEDYVLHVMPSSSLPATPAARKAAIQEDFAQGILDAETYQDLLELPDIEAHRDDVLAGRWHIDQTLERFLEAEPKEGEDELSLYRAPNPFDDLAYAVKRGIRVLAEAALHEAPEPRLELLRRYVLDAQTLLAQAAQPPPPPGGMPGAPPPDAAMMSAAPPQAAA